MVLVNVNLVDLENVPHPELVMYGRKLGDEFY